MRRSVLLCQLSLLTILSYGQSLQVPTHSFPNIDPDGQFDEQAWSAAHIYQVSDSVDIYFLQDQDHFYLGIHMREKQVARYVDVYLDTEDSVIINLHSSMQLGERILNDHWNDTIPDWSWGNNSYWNANTVNLLTHNDNVPFLESVEPYEGFEFIISKHKLDASEVRIRIEMRDFLGEAEDMILTPRSERYDAKSWPQLYLVE